MSGASRRPAAATPDLATRIDAVLPQTQCMRCGYEGCRPYAEAVAAGAAAINQCPPGGAATIAALAALLHRPELPLDPAHGVEGPLQVAWIDPVRCIGCARCLPPCPVDAIVGANKYMHTVLRERCTGCALCIAPCPVDCIEMRPAPPAAENHPHLNRGRYAAHTTRLRRQAEERRRDLATKKAALAGTVQPPESGLSGKAGS